MGYGVGHPQRKRRSQVGGDRVHDEGVQRGAIMELMSPSVHAQRGAT